MSRIVKIKTDERSAEIVGIRLLSEREVEGLWRIIPKVDQKWWIKGNKAVGKSGVFKNTSKRNSFRPALILKNTNQFGGANPGDKFVYNGYTFTVINVETALCDQCIGSTYKWCSMETKFPIYFQEVAA